MVQLQPHQRIDTKHMFSADARRHQRAPLVSPKTRLT